MKYDLLTGATGLLGRYLLRDLLHAGCHLAVLARPGKVQSAAERVEAILGHWEAGGSHALPRPVILEGELSESGLGLGEADRRWAANHCRAVIHSAAAMAFRPDARGEPWRTNVQGTANLLDFCHATGIRQFHHVSTAYLCGLRTGRILESELDVGQTLGNVYEDSKLQAEKLVRQAGFDLLTVYRPASIVGDSQTGYTSNYHGFYLPLQLAYAFSNTIPPAHMNERFCARLGLTGDEGKNFVPVDWVAAAIARIVISPSLHGRTYHLASSEPVRVRLYQAVVQDAIERFSKRPTASAVSDATLAQFERLFHDQMLIYRSHWRDDPIFDLQHTQAALPQLPCPKMDRELLLRVARFAVENAFAAPRHGVAEPPVDVVQQLGPLLRAEVTAAIREPGVHGIALQVNGPGGGQWHLAVRHGEVLAAGRGLGCEPDAACYLNSGTFAALAHGQTTLPQAMRAGRVVIEGPRELQHEALRMLEQWTSAPAGDPA